MLKSFELFEKFRTALADEAVKAVGPDALLSVLRYTSNPNSRMLTARHRSASLLDRAAHMGYFAPLHLKDEFGAIAFYLRQTDKLNLVKGLGRALVGIESGATSCAFLMGHVVPQGPLSTAAKQRVAIAGPTTLVAYLLARYVQELLYLPPDQFVRLLHEMKVTGQLFMFTDDERVILGMPHEERMEATTQGFLIGQMLAFHDPSLDEESSSMQLRLTPAEVKQLAFNGRHNFEPFLLEQDHGNNSDRSGPPQLVHEDGDGS
ncbi:hypothetical protein WKW77_30660 [Variovorax ureilyticus]|uniref:Uncharacterized protein n=1 Tax=Variovorax ureilyticus TaxID=1836198 RepID=A0ABU8VQ51_9BURK